MKLRYMNSRRLFKPNLPNAPKRSKLLAPTGLRWTLSSLAYRIPQSPIASIKMKLVPFELLPKHQNTSSLIWVWWDKDLAKCTSQGYVNGEGESRGIWRIKGWKLLMSQFCFSLRFLSQNSLWKLSTFCRYKGIYSKVYEECEESVITK